jgi:hypothetical protein
MPTTITPRTKPVSTAITGRVKPSNADSALLQENSFYLLLESGFKILIARYFTNREKPISTTITPRTKP